jgi:endogenous inhibitor of DNA gyrase (YacG/DUF329 family)
MKQKGCSSCGAAFGLVRQRYFGRAFCSRRCKELHVIALSQGPHRVKRWVSCLSLLVTRSSKFDCRLYEDGRFICHPELS